MGGCCVSGACPLYNTIIVFLRNSYTNQMADCTNSYTQHVSSDTRKYTMYLSQSKSEFQNYS